MNNLPCDYDDSDFLTEEEIEALEAKREHEGEIQFEEERLNR